MNVPICQRLCLDSAGASGPAEECSQPVGLSGGKNAVQLEMIVYALTATNVSCQLQESNDLENWTDKGTAQTTTSIGRKLLTTDGTVSAAHLRYKFTLTGTGKAVFAATVNLSDQ